MSIFDPHFSNGHRSESSSGIALPSPFHRDQSSSASLRRELAARHAVWAEQQGLAYEQTFGAAPTIIFRPDANGRHANFYPASYRRILRNPDWSKRLAKTHTSARRILVSHDTERRELDSCNSSDALLMSIFCHPCASKPSSRLRAFLHLDAAAPMVFGVRPHIPVKNGRIDTTEIDLCIGDLMIEAKLTETDFQSAPLSMAERYCDFDRIFDLSLLPAKGNKLQSYQLVRGILAALSRETTRYCLICDARRGDLIAEWYAVLLAIRPERPRWRCVLVTWQEIAANLPLSAQKWLQAKYGIVPKK